MNSTFKKYKKTCKDALAVYGSENILNIENINENNNFFIAFKHDVETSPKRALKVAKIEYDLGISSIFYVQGYLLRSNRNIKILNRILELGHTVSYHYDVLDHNKGDYEKAEREFDSYLKLFAENGFTFKTICQHGNPLLERNGYNSNRDFFREKSYLEKYSHLCDIMVDFKTKRKISYNYVSDAGREWKFIKNPTTSDLPDFKNLKDEPIDLPNFIREKKNNGESIIVSTHPHRYYSSAVVSFFHHVLFIIAKKIVKVLIKNRAFKSFYEKHYEVAKKL